MHTEWYREQRCQPFVFRRQLVGTTDVYLGHLNSRGSCEHGLECLQMTDITVSKRLDSLRRSEAVLSVVRSSREVIPACP